MPDVKEQAISQPAATAEFKPTVKQLAAMTLLAGPASNILLYGGSRSGKTFLFLRMLIMRAIVVGDSTHAIIRKHLKDARQKIGMRDLPQVLRLCFPGITWLLNKTDWVVTFPHNGSTIWLCGLDETGDRAEQILGMEFSTMYYNEASELSFEAIDLARSRLAEKNQLKNQSWYDCNPPRKRHWLYKMFFEHTNPESNVPLKKEQYANMQMNPGDNIENIDENYIAMLEEMSPRKRKRFLYGEFADEERGKLFQQAWIDDNRVEFNDMPELKKIVTAVDPAMSKTKRSDGTGIITVALGIDDEVYILHDGSKDKATPQEWARASVSAYTMWESNYIVAEVNQGGDLVKMNIQQFDDSIPVKMVRASRGKYIRAEPIAALYEKGVVHHVGEFPDLEDEMTGFDPDKGKSPDRMDAMVYGVTELGFKKIFRPRVAGGSHEVAALVEEGKADNAIENPYTEMSVKQLMEVPGIWN